MLGTVAFAPDTALANCTDYANGQLDCSANTTTVSGTVLDAGGLPSVSTNDRIIQWDDGTPIAADINAVTIDGLGLELLQTGATSGTITVTNDAGSSIVSNSGSGTPALALIGNSGKIDYSGSGSIVGNDQAGIYATNSGTGQIQIVTTGIIQAGDNTGGDDYGIYTSATNGATTIDLTGGTIEGATAGGLGDGAGIYSRSVGGNVTITANNIGADTSDRSYTGIDAAITGTASGQLSVTSLGTIYATQTGISAVNNNTGGIVVNLNSGSTLDVSGGIATVGEYVRDTGSAGGITINNQAGSLIDPAIGVDSQIVNNANSGNVAVHQNGAISATDTGIIAATNGTGNVTVDGSGNIVGGAGAFALSTTSPVTADNAGIVAIQNGTSGGVTVGGSGTTSATGAITAEITDASNGSAILVNRSGANSITGTDGFGVNAVTQGAGTVTVMSTGAIAGSGGGTVAFGINASGQGGNILVQNTGAITADGTDGYGIAASTINNGTVTVSGTGAITANGNGISATTTGGGAVTVTGTGAIVADNDSSGAGTGIIATSVGGNITVTPGSTVSGANGIDAETSVNGTVTVTTSAGSVAGTTGYGVKTVAQNGATIVTNNINSITGATDGVNSSSTNGKITITGSGSIGGGSGAGIVATMSGATGTGVGTDGILISGTGNVNTTGAGDGIDASITSASNHSNITINRSGTVTAGNNGILATTLGDGNVTVINTGNVRATTGTGIDGESQGGNILISPSGTVSDASGIYGSTNASGTVTITTAFGSAGNVTGSAGFGIGSSAENGNTYITNNATTVQGSTFGVNALSNGTGGISVIGAGDYTGGSAGGIYAVILGTGPSGGSGVGPGGVDGIYISGSGKTTTTDGDAIHAFEAGGTADILVNRTGLVTVTDTASGGDGIYAVTNGSGNVTVTSVTGVSAGYGAAAIGIDAESNGGNIIVTPAGTVTGGNGIKATTNGSGTVLVQTIVGASGNVSGVDGYGVLTSAQDGNTTVNNRAAQISGTTWADNSTSTGTGTLLIEGAGNYVGGTGGGIGAYMTGIGPVAGNTGIHITGTGNTSATTGSGIHAEISNPANESDIVIDRSGTVTVNAAGGDGIYAHTSGDGNVLIHDVSNVQAGTGGSAHGIDAASNGGDVTVDLSTPLLNTATVSGGNGISAVTTNGGDVTVTTYTGTAGNVTGLAGYGVNTSAVDGNTVVTNNAKNISGTTWADTSSVSGLGAIEITDSGVAGNGNFVGGSSGGISAVDTGTGPSAGIGPDSDAAIWISGSGNTSGTGGTGIYAEINNVLNGGSILIDRTGTVTDAGGNGIDAEITNGTGNVTVDGTGAVIADDTGSGTGITALAQTGDVTVTPASTVYGSAGIDAETGGTGTVTVTTVGDITGTYGDGIHAASVDGDINVTTAAGTLVAGDFGGSGTGDGIDAQASGAGNVHVIANSDVSGDPGIIVTSATGNAWATVNGTTTGLLDGVVAEVTSPAATSFVLVDGTGNVTGGTNGIYADNAGSGTTTVTGGGNTLATGGYGIYAHAVAGNVLVDRSGTVTASGIGIDARSTGGGDVTVNGVGDVLANTSAGSADGIVAYATGGDGNVSVTPAGTVSGNTGITASAVGTGTVTVTTASGAAGNVTGTGQNGIESFVVDGDSTVTNNAALVTGVGYGVYSLSTGLGAITIDGSGTYNGTNAAGIIAQESGIGPGAGNNGIHITGSGNTTTDGGYGIQAYISNSSNASNILIDRTGTVTVNGPGGQDGIAATTAGAGNITITGVGNVNSGPSPSDGIYAEAFGGGDVLVEPAGTVTGGYDGIYARAHGATGDVTVTTASGAAGNVIGTVNDGIHAMTHDGNIAITNNADLVTGGVTGAHAVVTGAGSITIDGSGTYTGTTGYGIRAYESSTGPGAGNNGIHITGSGDATTTSGIGISAVIASSSNASNILIDRTGAVTVGSGGGDGIDAVTAGAGNVTVTGTGPVTAGTGSTTIGILATSQGGNVDVEPASTVYGGGVGIDGETNSTGTVTIVTVDDITGDANDGIRARSVDGDISVTTAADTTVTGDNLGTGSGDGIDARASGAGNVRVLANSDVYGDPGIISTSATGYVWATANGTTVGDVAEGVYAEVTSSSATSSAYVLVDGSGNVTGATTGIYANNNGAGDTTVSGSGNTEGQNGDGIDAFTVSGNVLVNRSGTITGTEDGIDAYSSAGGDVTVTGTGDVLGDISGSVYDGIYAASEGGNGNVSVTPAGTVDGDFGIYALAQGTGTVTVTTASGAAGNVTGHAGDGIDGIAHDGNVAITNDAALVSGTLIGAYGATDGIGAITVGGAGTYHGGTGYGIEAVESGDGPALGSGVSASLDAGIWITGSGATTSDTGGGIYAAILSPSNVSDIVIDRSGAVTVGAGGGNGITATTNGSGNISVTGTGPVTAGTGSGTTGIEAIASGGDVDVEPASSVHGGKYGIDAETTGTGTVTVVTHGDITGDTDDGIHARSVDGAINITTAAGTTVTGDALHTGSGDGIDARASGAGNVHVIANSAVYGDPAIIVTSATGNAWATANGTTQGVFEGVYAQVTSASATSFVLVDGSGNVTGGTTGIYADNVGHGTTTVSGTGNTTGNNGNGIDAYAVDGAVLVNRTGTVTATRTGIDAETTGGGSVTVTGTGAVLANTGAGGYTGIVAVQAGGNGAVSVTPASTVSGATGIFAESAGTGAVTVTTASGAGGNVTGTAYDGIDALSIDGTITVTNNATTVSGHVTGLDAESTAVTAGDGAISVLGSGTFTGSTGNGIQAIMHGFGPVFGTNGISISGSVKASTTSGVGIYALINNASNASSISITTTGTVTVASGGEDGIDALTIGGGNITIGTTNSNVGNVVAGTGATSIYATTSGGNGNVSIATNGTISGARGVYASAVGTGTVTVTTTKNTAGNAGNGIETAAVNGATHVNVNSGTVTGSTTGKAGVNESASGSGGLFLTVASGATVTGGSTASGVRLSQTGTGANTITNTGTIIGAGTSANPVIAVGAASGSTTITNNVGGTIRSNSASASQPADLAILSTTTTGADSIVNHGTLNGEIKLSNASNSMNNSGTWNVRDNTSTSILAAAFGSSGSNTLTNSGTINAGNATASSSSTFTGVQTFTNSGIVNAGLNGTSDVTTFDASGHPQTVTNTGTFNVHGTLNFIGDATFYNAGGIIDMRTSGSATTDVTGLNVTASGNTYSPGVDYDFAGGTNSRLGVDTYVGDLSSAGSTVPSDRLLISGDATSTTGILVNDTNAGFGSYNPVGITLVGVNGTSSDAFYLQSLTSSSPYDVLETGVGPMGAIKKGFFFYPLLQSTHGEAVSDGLTGANSTEYRLYGLPDVEAYQLPLAITGAENIWYETAEGWDERQEEARRYWDVYADRRTKSSGKSADVWLKGTGSWTKRDVSFDPSELVPAASVLGPISADFKQDVASIQLGVDGQLGGTRDGALVLGGSVGYVKSSMDFQATHNTFDYSGGIIDATADYYNGPWFVDVLAKVDLLRTTLRFNSLSAFGYTDKTVNTDTYGALSTAGYHFVLDREHTGHTYLEPLLSLTYTQTNMDSLTLLGTGIDFDAGKTFRGGIGARLGTLMGEKKSFFLDGSITAQYWDEFTNSTDVILSTMGPALSLNDEGRRKGFGQVTGMLDIADGDSGWSGFLNGGAKFNSEFTTVELKGGVRYQW